MAGIFNLFSDSTQAVKAPTVLGLVGSNVNSTLKLKNIGAPGATPGKIFGQKSKGLSVRSSSELNIHSPSPISIQVKKCTKQAEKLTLKPFEIFGESNSPVKQKSPTKLKSPQKQLKTLSPKFVLSSNVETRDTEKYEEFVFKKPRTPKKSKKLNMDYPEPEGLAPIGDIEIELFDLTGQDFLKACNNKYFSVDDDEGFLSDSEPVPIVQEGIHSRESVSKDMEVALPDLEPFLDSDRSFN